MTAFGLELHTGLLNALASEFSTAWSDRSHAAWQAAFLNQHPGVTNRVKVEIKLPNGDLTWVNIGDEGNLETRTAGVGRVEFRKQTSADS